MTMGAQGGGWLTAVLGSAGPLGVAAAAGWCALGILIGAALAVLGARFTRAAAKPDLRTERAAAVLAGLDRLAVLSEVVRLVAHGVRNSLSVVVSCASLLEKDRPPEQRRELLAALAEEGDRMQDLVNQLAALAGTAAAQVELLDVEELLQAVVSRARAHADWRADLTLSALAPGTGLEVRGDRLRLECALLHLLLCAMDSGASAITLRATGEPGAAVRFAVDCTGGHVPDSLLAGGHENPEPELLRTGPWLWLAVARRAVRAHDGELEVGHDLRGALTASLVLPAAARDARVTPPAERVDGATA